MPKFDVEAADDGNWRVLKDGVPFLEFLPGGTGPCWNMREANDPDGNYVHLCEIDEAIGALTALRESSAYRENIARW